MGKVSVIQISKGLNKLISGIHKESQQRVRIRGDQRLQAPQHTHPNLKM